MHLLADAILDNAGVPQHGWMLLEEDIAKVPKTNDNDIDNDQGNFLPNMSSNGGAEMHFKPQRIKLFDTCLACGEQTWQHVSGGVTGGTNLKGMHSWPQV